MLMVIVPVISWNLKVHVQETVRKEEIWDKSRQADEKKQKDRTEIDMTVNWRLKSDGGGYWG